MTEEDVALHENEEADLPETEENEEEAPQETTPEEPEVSEDREGDDRKVPYGALHSERKQRQALQQQLDELRGKWSTAEERLNKLTEATEIPDFIPDFDEDPVAHLSHKVDKLYNRSEEQQRAQQEWANQQQLAQQRQHIVQTYQSQAREFSERQPDFGDGYRHFVKSWTNELTMMGYTPTQANEILSAEEAKLVERASRTGENAAELVYNIAKSRGYQPKQKNNLGTIKEGQKAAKSMGGGKVEDRLTLEALAEMDPDDFAKMSDKDFRRVMGG